MPELNDLMDDLMGDVRADLTAVRLPPGAELRRRVRRRQRRVIAAVAVTVVTAVTAGAAVLARPHGQAPPRPATSPSVTARPVKIPLSALLRPEDVGAGPDSQIDGEDGSGRAVRFEMMLDACFTKRAPGMLAVDSYYFTGLTFLLGTSVNRPEWPFVLAQDVYRLAAPQAAAFLTNLGAAIRSCDGFTQTGEIERPGGKVPVRGEHGWSVVASGFAGDESILVRHNSVGRNAQTGKVIGESTALVAVLRVGNLVTVLRPASTSAEDLRRFATIAAARLCATADPPC